MAEVDTLVICPAALRPGLDPWIKYRQAQGHKILVQPPGLDAPAVRDTIRLVAKSSALRFVVLVGDADPRLAVDPIVQRVALPTHHVPAEVNVRFGSEPWIASDNWYADLDDDRVPDLAIGRLTADSNEELSVMVDKIIRYERDRNFGPWRQRLNFVAGMGGFGLLADAAIEACAKKFITEGVPPSYSTTMTYGSWRSPYCPDPREFKQTALARLNEGSLFWVYIGHGHHRGLDRIAVPGRQYPILDTNDMSLVRCQQGSPIALFLACYTAAFDAREDCLAEELLRGPQGPVAVLGGSRVTMPYAMAVLGSALLQECFVERQPTLGQVFCQAKRRSVLSDRTDPNSQSLDALARAMQSGADLAAERREHLDLFNLLGDPLLRLPQAASAQITSPSEAMPGQQVSITGKSPVDGPCLVELVVRRDRLSFSPPARPEYDESHASLVGYQQVYDKANDTRLVTIETTCQGGDFRATLVVPETARGACHIRAAVRGTTGLALGANDLTVRKPPVQAQSASGASESSTR